jgi:hypothetical protein
MYLALLAAAILAGCLLRLLVAGVTGLSSASGIGETTGIALALFLVAALVSTLQVLVYRGPIASALSPTAVGMIVLAAFALLSYRGFEAERSFASSTSPDASSRARRYPSTEVTSNQFSFVTLSLPFEVAIDIPRGWWVLNDTINRLIRTSRDAVLDLRGVPTFDEDETVLIAANSWPPETYAALRVTRVQPPLAMPEEVLGLTRTELVGLSAEFETEMRYLLPLQGLTFLEATEIEVQEIGPWPAIVFSYRRSGPKGPVSVELVQVVRRRDYLRINLSYREDERALWMPVIMRIKNSIRAGPG